MERLIGSLVLLILVCLALPILATLARTALPLLLALLIGLVAFSVATSSHRRRKRW